MDVIYSSRMVAPQKKKLKITHRVQTSANAVRSYPSKNVINIHPQLFQLVFKWTVEESILDRQLHPDPVTGNR